MIQLLPLHEIEKYEQDMKDLRVSEVARSPRGFLTAYKKGQLTEEWLKTRQNFIKRHYKQYIKNPTYRRYLALIAWAFRPKLKPRDINLS